MIFKNSRDKRAAKMMLVGCLLLGVMIAASCAGMMEDPGETDPVQPEGEAFPEGLRAMDEGRTDRGEGAIEQPQPEGGPEEEVREPHPVSNAILQREYPHILVMRGSLESNQVALTFDDGPDARFTPQVLDVLEEHDVQATFFLMGARAKEHADITRRIHEDGHAIGNHTYWHPNLPEEDVDRIRWEVEETEDVLHDLIDMRPKLFRAPYGALNEELVEVLGDMNNTVVGWNVDSLDWKQLDADEIATNVLSNTDPGAIILMHDGGHWTMDMSGTVEALHEIITRLQEDGMEFVTIPELVGTREAK